MKKPKLYFENLTVTEAQKSILEKKYDLTTDYSSGDIGVFLDPLKLPVKFPGFKILYLVEPEAVRPDLYSKSNLSKFDQVITVSTDRAKRINSEFVIPLSISGQYFPQYKKFKVKRNRLAAIINEHKFSASGRSMYGFRRELLVQSEKRNIPIDIYGGQWVDGKFLEFQRRIFAIRKQISARKPVNIYEAMSHIFHNYSRTMGRATDTSELLCYQYSIVIENDPDFVSEKLWKSFYAGAVPIYVGPFHLLDFKMKEAVIYCPPIIEKVIELLTTPNRTLTLRKRKIGYDLTKDASVIEKSERKWVLDLQANLEKYY